MAAYHEQVTLSAPAAWYSMDSLTARVGTNMTTGGGTLTYTAGPNTLLGNGMVFDGSSFGLIPRTVTDAFSIEFFIKTSQSGGSSGNWFACTGIMGNETAGVTSDFGILLNGTTIGVGMGSPDTSTYGPLVSDGTWHHMVITRTSSTIEFYKNGALYSSNGGMPTNSLVANASLGIGAISTGGANKYVGMLDELALYTRKITAGEVALHYAHRAYESSFYQVVG